MISRGTVVFFLNGFVETAPQRGGGGGRSGGYGVGVAGGGKSNSSSGGKSNTGKNAGYYLHGGLYPMSRTAKEVPTSKPSFQSKGIGAWGVIGIILLVIGLCTGLYYALYLCDLVQRNNNYKSNLASQTPTLLMTEKPKPEENVNGNIPMTDKNELAKSSMMNGTSEASV